MKKLLAIIPLALAVGCSSTNSNQVFHHTTLHGGFIKIGIPLTTTSSLGIQGGIGYVDDAEGINPTKVGTNVYSSAMSFADHSKNRQTGSATNTVAAILQGSDDSSVINLGNGSIGDSNNVVNAQSK